MRWALLRSPAALAGREGDVDLLVLPHDVEHVRRIATSHGFVPVPMPRDLHAADYDAAADRFIWLHVQTELRLGRSALPAATVLDVTVRDPLPRLPDDWLLWTLLLHARLDTGKIAERQRATLAQLARSTGTAAAGCPLATVAQEHRLHPQALLELVCAGAWGELERLPVTPPPAPAAPAHRRLSAAVERARWHWRHRGIGVAVIGPDGAGKTTLVRGLRRDLPFPVRVLYMGLTGGRLRKADALRLPGVVLAARLAILWVRYGIGLAYRLRRHVVVFDRYVLDGTVPSGAVLSPLARTSRRAQAFACPRPDLVLVLDASGDTMHRRAGEYDSDTLESWRAAYERLRGTRRVAMIDAEQPADVVLREAKTLIWRRYADRWRRTKP